MRNYILLSIFLSFAPNLLLSQTESFKYIPDTLRVTACKKGQLFYSHTVKSKETKFRIMQFYRLDSLQREKFMQLSPEPSIKEHQIIQVPINISTWTRENKGIPILYQVKKKETIYFVKNNISIFDTKELMEINHLSSHALKEGQWLIVAYHNYDLNQKEIIKAKFQGNKADSAIYKLNRENEEIDKISYHFSKRGVAAKSNIELGKGRFYALHREVKRGQNILISNPITGRSVIARVVGKLPRNYSNEVEVVVSSEVAKELLSVDRKFFVFLQYNK